MIRKVIGCIVGLVFAMMYGTASATIIWNVSGQVGDLVTGTDNEQLEGATLVLSVAVDQASYGDFLGIGIFGFAPISTGELTISGSGVLGNNTTLPLEAFPGGLEPLGYTPNFPGIAASNGWPIAVTLPSTYIMTVAHGFSPATPSGVAAVPGSPVSINDFPTGSPGFASITVAIQDTTSVLAQYTSTFGAYEVTEISEVIPEPSTLLLLGTGLLGVVGIARRRKSQE